MIYAVTITWDPAWPWSLNGTGPLLLLVAAGLLVGLTFWTYLGQRTRHWQRFAILLALRLAALAVAFLLALRPSFARPEEEDSQPSKILIFADFSESMSITDEFNNASRWENVQRLLQAPTFETLRKRLAERKVEIVFYQGAEDVRPLDLQGKPTGKRTDIGLWLHDLLQAHRQDSHLRGLLLFSDGADNGSRYPTLDKASQWRELAPIHTFGVGKATTTFKQLDIAVAQLIVEGQPVPVKSRMKVKAIVNAPGMEGRQVNMSLWMEDGGEMKPALDRGKPVATRQSLSKTLGNEILFECDAPNTPGEVKLLFKAEPLPDEVTALNNQLATFVPITKEGISILWVEGRLRAWEPVTAIRHALSKDPRFRVFYALNSMQDKGTPQEFFDLDKQHYDAIVIGDISAKQLIGSKPDILNKIVKKVQVDGTGLVMLGGLDTLGNGDWNQGFAAALAASLPVNLDIPGAVEGPARVLPTDAGLSHYLLKLHDNPIENEKIWKELFKPLDGMNKLGSVRPGATVLATRDGQEPMLIGTQYGKGRTLVFAGDTTWKNWRRSEAMLPAYERFWKQMMIWLAQQENVDGQAWVRPDTRRLVAGLNQRLGLSVGLRGKGGIDLKNAQFQVKVMGPNKSLTDVPVLAEGPDNRGYFLNTRTPGEFKIDVTAKGKEADGSPVEGTSSARFLIDSEDIENLRPAADLDFLQKISQASGGKFQLADERGLVDFLQDLVQLKNPNAKAKIEIWPDWRKNPPSSAVGDQLATLWQTALLPAFLLFVALLSLEWLFRRKWGMV